MFGKIASLFGVKPPPPAPAAGPQLAMPLFASIDPVPPEAVVAQWGALFPHQPPLRVKTQEGPGDPIEYVAGETSLLAIHIPMPIPNDEAVHAVQTSWMWQQPDTAVRDHVAHAIVSALPGGDVVASAWNVARLSDAMMRAGAGVALYWGNGRQVHAPPVVEELARSEELAPVPLWVGVTVSGESDLGPFSAITHGLEPLGHRELEVRESKRSVGDIRTTLLDIALYVLQRGPVLKHGQTFGPSPDEKWKIRHEASQLEAAREVIVLGMP